MDQRKNQKHRPLRLTSTVCISAALLFLHCRPGEKGADEPLPSADTAGPLELRALRYAPRAQMLLGLVENKLRTGLSDCTLDLAIGNTKSAAWISGSIAPAERALLQSPFPPGDVTRAVLSSEPARITNARCTEGAVPSLAAQAVVSYETDDGQGGRSVTVRGLIRNNESRAVSFPVVNAVLVGPDGSLIGAGEGFSSFRVIQAGGVTPFAAEGRFFGEPPAASLQAGGAGAKPYRTDLLISAAFEAAE